MPVTTDIKITPDRIKLLQISPPGGGKTINAAGWWEVTAHPEERRQWKYLDLEDGYQPGDIFFYDFDYRMAPLAVFFPEIPIQFESFLSTEFDRFRAHFKALAEAIHTGYFETFKQMYPYPTRIPRTVVLDSLTFFADGLMQFLLGLRSGRKDHKSDDYKGEPRRLGGIDIPVLPEWMGESMGMSQILDIARQLPCNFIMNAHNTKSLDIQAGGGIKKKDVITIGSKIAQKVPGFFNEIYTLYNYQDVNMEGVRYGARTAPYGDDLGKSLLRLPLEIDITFPNTLYRQLHKLAGTGPLRLPGGEEFVETAEQTQ